MVWSTYPAVRASPATTPARTSPGVRRSPVPPRSARGRRTAVPMAKRTARKGRGSTDSTASCTTRKVEPNSTAAATSASEAVSPPRRTGRRYDTLEPAQVCAWYGPPVLDRRLHVLLDDERFERLARLA